MERGYVLHHRPFQESKALVNLLVDGKGRVDAVVRLGSGKRSIKSVLQSFQPLIFTLSGNSELKTLGQVESAAPAVPLSGQALYSGMYLNELTVRVLSIHHEATELFQVYHRTLLRIASQFCQSQLRLFEYHLLQELGAMPSLQFDENRDPFEEDIFYRFISEQGFSPCLNTKVESSYSGQTLLALRENNIQPCHFKELKFLMRTMLQPLLGQKPLLSRQLFLTSRNK